ncbi:hypothetical protein [Flavobacterium sp. HJJ]|uniref:hypothetical protein n=1 Tax=Flavobacterium sp. HJJ TaxID=2783792 RepID=UPI00188BFFC8|nr:hypothetical protein [Flavobacterium sp. HJJ]MBF4469990.1 hypothetical protein [Flavobacterium sp. HJJ]
MKLKIILMFLLSITFAYSQSSVKSKSNLSCSDLKVNEYYYNDRNTFKVGSIKLFSYKNGKHFDALNKFIIKNSENILELDLEDYVIMFHKPDTIFDYSVENRKFQDLVDSLNLSKIFSLDSESESYQKMYEEMQIINGQESISSNVFYLDKILVYNVEVYSNDKVSPYDEFLNIDLNKMKLVDFNSLIAVNQLSAFDKTILNYVYNRKKEIVKNYIERESQGFGDLLYHSMLAFEQSDYSLNKIKCKINSNDFYYFSPKGIIFTVNVIDGNLNMDEKREKIGEYTSKITIPYKLIVNYLDKKNSLYPSIKKQIATEIKKE